jgi:hypothetical protein
VLITPDDACWMRQHSTELRYFTTKIPTFRGQRRHAPEFLLAAVYAKPSAWPEARPKSPLRFGPCLWPLEASTSWHWRHLVLKIFAPPLGLPVGMSTSGTGLL